MVDFSAPTGTKYLLVAIGWLAERLSIGSERFSFVTYPSMLLPEIDPRVPTVTMSQQGQAPEPIDAEMSIDPPPGENGVIHHNYRGSLTYTPPIIDGPGYKAYPDMFGVWGAGRVRGTTVVQGGVYYSVIPFQTYETWFGAKYYWGCQSFSTAGRSTGVYYYVAGGDQIAFCFTIDISGTQRFGTVFRPVWNPDDVSEQLVRDQCTVGSNWRTSQLDHRSSSSHDVTDIFNTFVTKLYSQVHATLDWGHSDIDVFGELANRCVGSHKMTDANTASTVYETLNAFSEGKALVEGAKAVITSDPSELVQAVGNLRLSLKWGVPLTSKDATSIAEALASPEFREYYSRQDRKRISRASMSFSATNKGILPGVTGVSTWTLKTIVKDNKVAHDYSGYKRAVDMNVVSLETAWDIVPYSFVVDWLTDFSSVLSAADNVFYRTAYWDIIGSVRGSRRVITIPGSAINAVDEAFSGSLVLVDYMRYVSHTIPLPTLGFLHPSVGVTQWIDGATLVGQYIGH